MGDASKTLHAIDAAPLLFVLLWSTGFIGAKLGLPFAEPLTFLLFRFACVIVLLSVLAVALRRPWPVQVQQYMHIAAAGILLHAGYLSGVFSAIHRGMSAGVVALIVGVQPLLTALLSGVVLQERVSARQWLGLLFGLLGVWLVVSSKLALAGVSMSGLLLALMALLSITCGTLYQKRYCTQMDLWTGSIVQFVASSAVLLPIALVSESMHIEWNGQFVFAVSWLVLVLSVGAISLLHLLIRRGAATRVSALFYLTPPTTAVLAFIVFGERLTPSAMLGMAVAAFAVWLVVRRG